jgi:hypothetical protein
METQQKAPVALSAREFGEGLFAALAAVDHRQINANQPALHKAFRRVLLEVNKTNLMLVDFSDVDFDPLYGLSGWLDEFLARAQRDLLISSPNPSYERIEIKVTPEEGKAFLSRYPNESAFTNLSNMFIRELGE